MDLNKELKEDFEKIKVDAKAFIDQNIEYYQLLGLKISCKAFSLILKIFLLALFLSIALLFISIASAFALGNLLESYTLGFLIIGGIYLLVTAIVYLNRNKLIDLPVIKKLSEMFYEN
nr:competence protein [uncultured Flavobacterium sp.]